MKQKELSATNALLDEKGRLFRSFWSTEEQKEYSRSRLSHFRSREWECLQLLGDGFVFRLLFGHFASIGICRAAFTDLKTGDYSISGPLKLFSGDDYLLDFGMDSPYHFFREEEDFFISLDFDGQYYRIRSSTDCFDVELMLPVQGDMLLSASPFENPRRFFYASRRVFPELRGAVQFKEKHFSLDGAFLSLENCRAVLPFTCSRVFCTGSQTKEGHSISLVLGWGFSHMGAGLENCVFLDGELMKLNRVREKRTGSFLSRSRFYSEDGSLELVFTPSRDELFCKDIRLLYFRSHCTVGHVSGHLTLRGIGDVLIHDMPFMCEHSRFRF